MQKVLNLPYENNWVYKQVTLKECMDDFKLVDDTEVKVGVGPSLKISRTVDLEKIGKIHAIGSIHEGQGFSNVRYITHHDTITAMFFHYRLNPLYSSLGYYLLGFITKDKYFLDPYMAYKVAKHHKQIHESIITELERPLFSNEVLFF